MALLKLAERYSPQRLESTCRKALFYTSSPNLKSVQSILKSGQDKLLTEDAPAKPEEPKAHKFTRGAGYYMKKFRKEKLLILYEWLLYPLEEAKARDVLELVEAQNKVASTIFCSQYGTSEWHENLFDPTLADAICDRIIYTAYTIQIEGESMRKRKGIPE